LCPVNNYPQWLVTTGKIALDEAVQLIKKSANPIVIADVELLRYNLSEEFRTFIQASGLIYATMMMGKAIIGSEQRVLFLSKDFQSGVTGSLCC
jgi:TPP-dependent 2-oxoacid decarboxylase